MLTLRSAFFGTLLLALLASPSLGQVVIRAVGSSEDGAIETIESFSFSPLKAASGTMFGDAMMTSDPLSMLQMKQFADELTLVEDQQKELKALAKEVRKIRQEAYSKLRQPNGRLDISRLQTDMRATQEAIREKTEKALSEILLPAQRERLEELQTQMQLKRGGLAAVRSNRLAELIGLTDDQKKELSEKQADYQKQLKQGIEELKANLQKEMLDEVLTKDQIKKLTKLQGERVTVAPPSFGDRIESIRKRIEERTKTDDE